VKLLGVVDKGFDFESPSESPSEAGKVVTFRFKPAEVDGFHSQYLEAREKAIAKLVSMKPGNQRFRELAADGSTWEFILEGGLIIVERVQR